MTKSGERFGNNCAVQGVMPVLLEKVCTFMTGAREKLLYGGRHSNAFDGVNA